MKDWWPEYSALLREKNVLREALVRVDGFADIASEYPGSVIELMAGIKKEIKTALDATEYPSEAPVKCPNYLHYLCADNADPPLRECLAQPGQCGRSS